MSKIAEAPTLSEEEIQEIYEWVDEVPLSRPKRNIARDFADGAMIAELVAHYFPRLVELHNYPGSHAIQQKSTNWALLNAKIFRKLGFQVAKTDIDRIVNATPDAVEKILGILQKQLHNFKDKKQDSGTQPSRVAALAQPKVGSPERVTGSSALKEKDLVIQELKETIEIMESKILKLEQLVKLKDSKMQILQNKIATAGIT